MKWLVEGKPCSCVEDKPISAGVNRPVCSRVPEGREEAALKWGSAVGSLWSWVTARNRDWGRSDSGHGKAFPERCCKCSKAALVMGASRESNGGEKRLPAGFEKMGNLLGFLSFMLVRITESSEQEKRLCSCNFSKNPPLKRIQK